MNMNAKWNRLKATFITFVVMFLVFSCTMHVAESEHKDAVIKEKTARFIILQRFYAFEGATGKIVQDKVTKRCYLYIWDGMGNGGPAITNMECPK